MIRAAYAAIGKTIYMDVLSLALIGTAGARSNSHLVRRISSGCIF